MIPIINCTTLQTSETLRTLDSACRNWGAFHVVDHGLDHDIVTALDRSMREFFTQPREQKTNISRSEKNPWGYYDQELTKNSLDLKEIYDYGPGDGADMQPQWPDYPSNFQAAIENFYDTCEALSFQLLEAISANLGASAGQLGRAFRPSHTSFLRLNHYPCADNAGEPCSAMGVHEHTDAGVLTILLQDQQAGLEINHGGQWKLIEPLENALVINLGDIVQVWSNDRYRAPLHRVIASKTKARFSAPFFFNPDYRTDYHPLPSTIDSEHPAKYRAINWGKFREGRAQGDYANFGEEIQISQFRQ
ncbi:MAG: 2OG-Fe(II) oxygenase family protein [Halioglobus sp.]